MGKRLSQLIQTLRDELQAYGKLLARLERQADAGPHRFASYTSFRKGEIGIRCRAISHAQQLRWEAWRNVARALHLKSMPPLEALIPLLPDDYQAMISGLHRQNRERMEQVVSSLLINRKKRSATLHRARQNDCRTIGLRRQNRRKVLA